MTRAELVDVIANGLSMDRGIEIVVTKARGNRVVVRAVEAWSHIADGRQPTNELE